MIIEEQYTLYGVWFDWLVSLFIQLKFVLLIWNHSDLRYLQRKMHWPDFGDLSV